MRRVRTLDPVTIMKRLSKMLEQSIQNDDEEYFYDRLHFMKNNYDNDSDVYKSNKVEDKIINQDSEEYDKYAKLSQTKMTTGLYNTFDRYLKRKYKIKINEKALDVMSNY